jgi:hypothetical protein
MHPGRLLEVREGAAMSGPFFGLDRETAPVRFMRPPPRRSRLRELFSALRWWFRWQLWRLNAWRGRRKCRAGKHAIIPVGVITGVNQARGVVTFGVHPTAKQCRRCGWRSP